MRAGTYVRKIRLTAKTIAVDVENGGSVKTVKEERATSPMPKPKRDLKPEQYTLYQVGGGGKALLLALCRMVDGYPTPDPALLMHGMQTQALYDFSSTDDGDLSFRAGDILRVTDPGMLLAQLKTACP